MISSLKINNIALIEENNIKLESGFNALTGETGAGKSIIIDSLNFVLGGKAEKTLIKTGKDFAKVEVVFDLPCLNDAIVSFFQTINAEPETTIIISRYYNLNGKNEVRVNGEAVTLGMLKKLTINLVDIHGQHDHQALLDPKNHIKILDSLDSEIETVKTELVKNLNAVSSINHQISELGGMGEEKARNIALLEYEINEIELAQLDCGEEEQLVQKRKYYQNSEKLSKNLNDCFNAVSGVECNIANQLKSAVYSLGAVECISPQIAELKSRLNSVMYEINDVSDSVSDLIAQTDYNEDEVNILEERLDLIKDLKRKYGGSVENVLMYLENAKHKLENLKNSEQALLKLNSEKQTMLKTVFDLCERLTQKRKTAGDWVKEKLAIELKFLGIKNGVFEIVFNNDYNLTNIESKATQNGADNVEFLFSANLGIEPRPLSKIISGGELSRFMLAFKCVVQDNSGIKTLIFDEIDSGIGGLIGACVGKKITAISRHNQVVCITHLAQIACFADVNFKIEKSVNNNITSSNVCLLDKVGKVKEIARMLGLNENAKTALASAQELIAEADNFKNNLI